MNITYGSTLTNLLVNDDFVNYVVNPTLVLNDMWEEFFAMHPEMKAVAEQAREILTGSDTSFTLGENEQQSLFESIIAGCNSVA